MIINSIQYEMGNHILDPIKNISDNQFAADINTLNNVLFDASIAPIRYDEFKIVDTIDNDYFIVDDKEKIEVSEGTVQLEEEDGKQKIVWKIPNLKTGSKTKLTIKIKLKDEYQEEGGIYPTNDMAQVISKIGKQEEDVTSTKTPILASTYKVSYEENAPGNCKVENVPKDQSHFVFDNVEISDIKPTCNGYRFKGWKVVTKNIKKVNDDYFIMPEQEVVLRAEWSNIILSKRMDGTVANAQTLYSLIAEQAVMDNENSEFVSNSTGINFSKGSSDTNGNGIYTRAGTEHDKYPVHYYRGEINDNNLIFGDFCWKIVRTTETGGVKLIYNGVPSSNGSCNNTGFDSQIGVSAFNSPSNSPTDIGYMVGNRNHFYSKEAGTVFWFSYVNKIRKTQSGMNNINYYYGDSVIYSDGQYILINPTQYGWSDYYSNLKGKYTCFSESESRCTEVGYIDNSNNSIMYYVTMVNGETYDSLIEQANQLKYVYGNDVTWNGTSYTLIDTIESKLMDWEIDSGSKIEGHRYTCLSASNTCNVVYYVHYTGNYDHIYYMTLTNGKNIDGFLNDMFSEDNNLRNQTDSTIKTEIDTWYRANMMDYTKYLEDTIWCNDRSFYRKNSFDKDYRGKELLYFGPHGTKAQAKPTTICPNKNDAFTVSSENGNGKLVYPSALLTSDELLLAGYAQNVFSSDAYLSTGQNWWALSPASLYYHYSVGFMLTDRGELNARNSESKLGVRPVISLKPDIMISEGDGTSENPYQLELED